MPIGRHCSSAAFASVAEVVLGPWMGFARSKRSCPHAVSGGSATNGSELENVFCQTPEISGNVSDAGCPCVAEAPSSMLSSADIHSPYFPL